MTAWIWEAGVSIMAVLFQPVHAGFSAAGWLCWVWGGGLFILFPLSCHSWQEETWKAQGANQFLGSDPYFELAVIMKCRNSHIWLYPWNCSTPTVAPDLILWMRSKQGLYFWKKLKYGNELNWGENNQGFEGFSGFFCLDVLGFYFCFG